MSLTLFVALAALHPHGPPAPAQVAEPARARANVASYVSEADYPPSALRERAEGTTGFTLGVGPDGRVTQCVVTASSGHAALDNAACSIMRRRARFTPARDGAGNPVADTVASRLTWRAPEPRPAAAPGEPAAPLRLIVTVSPAGEVTDCRPYRGEAGEAGRDACSALGARARSGEAAGTQRPR
jgi:TonB family protein